MKLSSFSENIVKETFERGGETVELFINIDAIVPDYYEKLNERIAPLSERFDALQEKWDELNDVIKKRQKEKGRKKTPYPTTMLLIEKEQEELSREMFAERLSCPVTLPDGSTTALLKAWTNVTDDVTGQPIPPSKENLMKMPPKHVRFLWNLCIKQTETVKKREESETKETLESAPDTSPGLHVVAQTG